MGYRSNIRWSTSKEGYRFLRRQLASTASSLSYPLVGMDANGNVHDFDLVSEEPNGYVFGFDGVKWYDRFEDVRSFVTCIEKLDNAGFPYTSVRIGEEYDDIEVCESDNAYDLDVDIPRLYPDVGIGW